MKSYLLLVLLLFLSSPTYSQFSTCDIRGTTPTLPCNYCTLSPTITIGANSTLPPTPQTTSVGLYSTSLALGTYSPSTTVATSPTAGPIGIGADTPTTPASTQVVTIADYSATLRLGRFANSIVMGISPTAPSIIIGATTPTPTPTTIQNINICPWCSTLSLGSGNTGGVSVATGPTAGPVTIGSPTSNPGQTVTVASASSSLLLGQSVTANVQIARNGPGPLFLGEVNTGGVYIANSAGAGDVTIGTSSPNVYIGVGSPTTKVTNVVLCQNSPSSSPTNQYCDIGQATTFIRFGENVIGGITIATGSTAAPVTIGRTTPAGAPSLAGSNRVNLLGLYHYFYNSMCFGNTGGSAAVLNCNYANVRTNAAVGGAPTTSGYNTAENRWYPPEPGHYMITVMGLILPAQYGAIYVITAVGGTRQTQVYARTYNAVDYSTVTGTTIQTFNSIGSGNYIEMQGTLMWDDGGASGYNVLSITRVA